MGRALLSLVPALTLLVGIGVAEMSAGKIWPTAPVVVLALGTALISPQVAMLALRSIVPGSDRILVSIAALLTSIGTTTLYLLSTSTGPDREFFQAILVRHGLFVGAGFLALVAGAFSVRYLDRVMRYPFTLLGAALVLTAATVAFGESINGARLWLQVGPVQAQPSEVSRLLLAGFVAAYLYDRRHLIAAPWRIGRVDFPPAPYLLPLVGAVLGAVAVLGFQNDLGMAALVVLGAFSSVAAVLVSRSSLSAAGVLIGLAAVASFAITPRVRDRVSGWLDPWRDPAGRGFQFVQADYGLAKGGLLGNGDATSAVIVPEIHTDFILVGLASQLGWLGASAVLALVGLLVCRCALVVMRTADGFRALLALSVGGMIGIQVLLIGGGTVRVLPLTGLTFPLLSYGGTSLIVTLFALGVVVGTGASDERSRPREVF